jgi:hypothetical protein
MRSSISDEVNYEQTFENPRLISIMAWLRNEVTKYIKGTRISESTLSELDSKVKIEIYVREKRDAILKDRGVAADEENLDALTNLERVQQQNLPQLQEKLDEVKS